MRSPAPPWLGRIGDVSDTERYRSMTPSERLECFVEVTELAQAVLAGRVDAPTVLERVEPLSAEAERTWRRLVAEARRAREDR